MLIFCVRVINTYFVSISSRLGGVVPRQSHKLQAPVQFGEAQHFDSLRSLNEGTFNNLCGVFTYLNVKTKVYILAVRMIYSKDSKDTVPEPEEDILLPINQLKFYFLRSAKIGVKR